ncbi:amino acid adenylation domain-containing protein [Nitrosomonas sp.]|uniref:amino acid adenylation domain-containing protein n=1 Tax=Nitrosomonas sp. TaxID=42353 RepID=UPI0037CCB5DC
MLRSACTDENLVTLLRHRVDQMPDACAYVFLMDGEHQEQSITYKELDSRARMIAGYLQANHKAGERALLLYPSSLDYIVAFFACLYAGLIAVPVYPPSRHHLRRLEAIIHDATPTIILTTAEWQSKLQGNGQENWGQNRFDWLATDRQLSGDATPGWKAYLLKLDSLAFLQYTSGSTGTPKGVMVSHGNLMANQRAIQAAFKHSSDTIVVGWLPFYHDMGLIGNILQPLYLGVPAILMSPMAFLEKPIRWLNTISKYRATTSGGPNFAYELCARKITPEQISTIDLSCWNLAFNGSEPVRAATLNRFTDVFSSCGFRKTAFFPCYGLAEATLFVTGRAYAPESKTENTISPLSNPSYQPSPNFVNCGHADIDHQVCIVNPETGTLRPDGIEGEIWVNGPSVTQGYWNQPVASEETFRAMLAGSGAHELPEVDTYLRTGDLGMFKRGNLYVTGRIKDLIVLRGHNYFPHDFEQALDDGVDALRPGCSAAFSINNENEEILVIVAEARRKKLSSEKAREILNAMRQVLGESSDAPIGILVLVPPGTVPKTSSGKIQRQACKQIYLEQRMPILMQSGEHAVVSTLTNVAYEETAVESLRDTLQQSTQTQRVILLTSFLRTHLARYLHIPETDLDITRSIRYLGLDSLGTVGLRHAVDTLLNDNVPLSLFLSDHSVRDLSEILASDWVNTDISPSVDITLDQKSESLASSFSELSCAQQAIWMVHSLETQSVAYNLHFAVQLEGFLKSDMARQAFDQLRIQHAQLRMRYRMIDDIVVQTPLLSDDWPEYFVAVDAWGWTEADIQADFAQRIRKPFDLPAGDVLHVTCYSLSEQQHILLFCAHHIAVDLRSVLILLNDLKSMLDRLISGEESCSSGANAISYRSFVTWQQKYLQSSTSKADYEYWRTQLAGTLPILALPIDFPRPPVPTYQGASQDFQLNLKQTEKLKHLGQRHSATLFMTLLAVYKILLYRYTHQHDLIVGTASHGRPQARFMNVVGNFVNPIALRSHLRPTLTFAAYLQQIRDIVSDGLSHADYPFSLLVKQLQPERNADHWPIYQTWFMLQQDSFDHEESLAYLTLGNEGKSRKWGRWQLTPKSIHEQIENFDLRLMAAENNNGITLVFKYRSDLFQAQTIARMADHFQELIARIVAEPEIRLGELSLLTHTEWDRQVKQWNATATLFPKRSSLQSLFETQARKTPGQAAASCNGEVLTYAKLNSRANQLAHYLRKLGVGPETIVGLCVTRSLDMLVSMLGILKAGGAYVPIDPNSPAERMNVVLTDANATVLVTHQDLIRCAIPSTIKVVHLDGDSETIAARSNANLDDISIPDHLVYVIYTSGSTGRPKGVAVSHANIINSTLARSHYYQDDIEGFLLLSSYTFDSSMAGIFWTLSQGGCVVMPSEGGEKDPQVLGELLSTEKITHLLCLPSFYAVLLASIPRQYFTRLKTIIVAGEACSSKMVAQHYFNLPQVPLFNEYGPTEGTVWSSVYHIQPEDDNRPIPIGKPILNTHIYLLDNDLNPVPIGVTGEIYIGGAGLARGYYGQSTRTAECFMPDPFGKQLGGRLYRSGDLARYRADGDIEYLGRIDQQVKIRGFRIELGEIETTLLRYPQIKEAIVLVHGEDTKAKRLVVYLVPTETVDIEDIRIQLKARLPDYMVPAIFIMLEAMPLTANGKIDRKALPDPENIKPAIREEIVQPRNSVEKVLVDIWMEVLDTPKPFGIHDDFFHLGGHSLSAIQVMVRIQETFKVELPVTNLFEATTVAKLADVIVQQQINGQDKALVESLLDELEQLPDDAIQTYLAK